VIDNTMMRIKCARIW